MNKNQTVNLGDVVTVVNENEYEPVENKVEKYVAGGHLESERIYVTKFGSVQQDREVIGSAFHKLFKKGDLLYGTRFPNLKKAAITTFDGLCSNTTLVLKTKKNSSLIEGLLPFILQWDKFTEFSIFKTVGSTNPYVRWRDLSEFQFLLPSEQEQKKIHDILWSIQNNIENLANLIQKFKIYQASTRESLFTKGINHKTFKKVKGDFGKSIQIPKDWKITVLANEYEFSSGSTPTRSNPEFFKGDIPWVSSTDLNRKTVHHTMEMITSEGLKNANLKIYPKGTFLIAIYGLEAEGTRGKCGILGIDAAINQACLAFQKSESIDTQFMFEYYLHKGEQIAFQLAQGTKQQNLSSQSFKFLKISLPPLPEQQKIASMLMKIQDQITLQEDHLKNLYALRKSMINKKMMQGKNK